MLAGRKNQKFLAINLLSSVTPTYKNEHSE
jgi:hypothetical protein